MPLTADDTGLIKRINQLSKNFGRLFLTIIIACTYSWIAIATTSDLQIVVERADFTLPIISARVSSEFFFILTPFILTVLYLYSLLSLFRISENVSELNITQPTGHSMEEHLHSIMLSGMIRMHVYKIRKRTRIFNLSQYLSTVVALWFIVPSTLVYFCVRYLTKHSLPITLVHIVFITISIGLGILFYISTVKQLRGELDTPFIWKKSIRKLHVFPVTIVSILIFTVLIIVSNSTRSVSSSNFVRANLSEQEVSQKPIGWKLSDGFEPVIGASLKNIDIKGALLNEAFMVKADLRGAKCSQVVARSTQLANSKLDSADFSGSTFDNVDFSKSSMVEVNFRNSTLVYCNLNSTNLIDADFSGATLFECSLWTAFPFSAEYDSANVQFSVFESPLLHSSTNRIKEAWNWPLAYYDSASLKSLGLPNDHNERLKKGDLTEYRFHDVDLVRARFGNMKLNNSIFFAVNLREAFFSSADLVGALFYHCNLEKVRLTYANIQNANLVETTNLDHTQVKQSKNWPFAFYSEPMLDSLKLPLNHNSLLNEKRLINYNLSGCYISEVNLISFQFDSSIFNQTTIHGSCDSCSFLAAVLDSSDCAGSSFRGANFTNASFKYADLRNTDLSNAKLARADFRGAILTGVNLTGAIMDSTDFRGATLIDFQGITEKQASKMIIDGTTMLPGNQLTNLVELPDSVLRKVLIQSTMDRK